VDANFAVMDVVRFLEDHPARIKGQKPSFDVFEIVDFQADVMKTEIHLHFAERGPVFKKRQIVISVRDRNISVWRSAQLFGAEESMIKVYEGAGSRARNAT
jgi:hypothetical protein